MKLYDKEVITRNQALTLGFTWISSFVGAYAVNSFAPIATTFTTQLVLFAYVMYAERRS